MTMEDAGFEAAVQKHLLENFNYDQPWWEQWDEDLTWYLEQYEEFRSCRTMVDHRQIVFGRLLYELTKHDPLKKSEYHSLRTYPCSERQFKRSRETRPITGRPGSMTRIESDK